MRSIACHSVFPYCDPFSEDTKEFRSLQFCHKTCMELQSKCGEELEAVPALRDLALSHCPSAASSPGDKPGCMYIDSKHPLKGTYKYVNILCVSEHSEENVCQRISHHFNLFWTAFFIKFWPLTYIQDGLTLVSIAQRLLIMRLCMHALYMYIYTVWLLFTMCFKHSISLFNVVEKREPPIFRCNSAVLT